MKKRLENMISSKKEQRDVLNASMIESDSKEQRAAIGETLSALGKEIAELEAMLVEADEPVEESKEMEGDARMMIMGSMDVREETNVNKTEERANAFVKSGRMTIENGEARAVLVSSGSIATPTEVSGINDIVGARVSSIVDLVKVVNATGMGAYKVAYQKTDAVADKQTEGEAYVSSEPTFGFVEIKPETAAVLCYISKQARKQSPLNYAAKVNESALIALRQYAEKLITGKLMTSALVKPVEGATAIDAKVLRKLALSYGGDHAVVGSAWMFLAKTDLIALGDIRSDDGKAVFEITPDAGNPNTGVIKDGGLAIPYCLCGNEIEGNLFYGQPHNFELPLFSDYEINVSEDFAFDKGLLAIRGDAELGGDVVAEGGFVKVVIG